MRIHTFYDKYFTNLIKWLLAMLDMKGTLVFVSNKGSFSKTSMSSLFFSLQLGLDLSTLTFFASFFVEFVILCFLFCIVPTSAKRIHYARAQPRRHRQHNKIIQDHRQREQKKISYLFRRKRCLRFSFLVCQFKKYPSRLTYRAKETAKQGPCNNPLFRHGPPTPPHALAS